jgi:hypothetical protein
MRPSARKALCLSMSICLSACWAAPKTTHQKLHKKLPCAAQVLSWRTGTPRSASLIACHSDMISSRLDTPPNRCRMCRRIAGMSLTPQRHEPDTPESGNIRAAMYPLTPRQTRRLLHVLTGCTAGFGNCQGQKARQDYERHERSNGGAARES